ncbi:MAG: hypothetical protein RLN85_12045, partial [Pseudomonadales bacterium]
VDSGKIIAPNKDANRKIDAFLAQITSDFVYAYRTAQAFKADLSYAENDAEAERIAAERSASLIHQTRLTGQPRIESTGNIIRAFEYFQKTINRTHHKVREQLAAINVNSAGSLKKKLSTMKAGESFSISSDSGYGAELRINGGLLFANSYFGGTASMGREYEQSYSMSFKKNDDGSVTFSIGRDAGVAYSAGVDVYFDVWYVGADGRLQLTPEVDFSLDGTRRSRGGDGLSLKIDAASLAAESTGTFFDKLWGNSINVPSLLESARDGTVSSSHSDVISHTYDLSAEISALPYAGVGDDPNAMGSFYAFLPGVGVEYSKEYKWSTETTYQPDDQKSRQVQTAEGSVRSYEASWYARLAATTRLRLGGPVGDETHVDGSPDGHHFKLGVPVYAKGAFSRSSVKPFSENASKRTLTPENKFLRFDVGPRNIDDQNGGERVLHGIEWSVSLYRDHTLLENPQIKALMDGNPALKADLIQLVSFTTNENREVISNQLELLKEFYTNKPGDNSAELKLIEKMNGYKDFTRTNDGILRESGDKADLYSNLQKLIPLAAEDTAVSPILATLTERLTDSTYWRKQRGREMVSVSVKLSDDTVETLVPLYKDGPDEVLKHILKEVETATSEGKRPIRVTSLSVQEQNVLSTKGKFGLVLVGSSAATVIQKREMAGMRITYDDAGNAIYDQSKTTGALFNEADDQGRAPAANPGRPIAGHLVPSAPDFAAFVAGEVESYFQQTRSDFLFALRKYTVSDFAESSVFDNGNVLKSSDEIIAVIQNIKSDFYEVNGENARQLIEDYGRIFQSLEDTRQTIDGDASSKYLYVVQGTLLYSRGPDDFVAVPVEMMASLEQNRRGILEALSNPDFDRTLIEL